MSKRIAVPYRILTCLVAALLTPALFAQDAGNASLTPQQQEQFTEATKDFAAERWTDALTKLKALHQAKPSNLKLTEFAAEAAINTGDPAYAIDLLKPVEAGMSGNWQARSILAHAYAQSRQDAARDAELQQLITLRKDTTDPDFLKVMQIVTERIPLKNGGSALLFYSLQPWSRYNIYEMARVYDSAGLQVRRITLESNDTDQPLWAKNHKEQAAAGMRGFSLDGYTEQTVPGGQSSQTHMTYAFLDGQPTYNAFRDKVMAIADGKGSALSSTSGIPVH